MDLGLKNKTILITGGNSKIGKAIALGFAKEGDVKVALTYYSDKKAAQAVTSSIKKFGSTAYAVRMNLGDLSSIADAVDSIIKKFGSIHVLVNNATFWGDPHYRASAFEQIPITHWQQMINTNLLGTISVIQSVVPGMKAQNFGRIVNISSDLATENTMGSGPYGTTKSALNGLTANLVTELSQYNILSNVVLPSLRLTEKATHHFSEEFQAAAPHTFPTSKITTPEDVASLVNYLGSAANVHVNGEYIRVTGKGFQQLLSKTFSIGTA